MRYQNANKRKPDHSKGTKARPHAGCMVGQDHRQPDHFPPEWSDKRGANSPFEWSGKGEDRKSLIQKIHIAKNQLCFDDDTYRDFLGQHGNNKNSCSRMTVPELFAVYNAFIDAGFKPKRRKNKDKEKPFATKAKTPLMKKIEALLADSGKPWAYAEGIAKQMYGKQRLQWCNVKQLQGVMIALQKQQRKNTQSTTNTEK